MKKLILTAVMALALVSSTIAQEGTTTNTTTTTTTGTVVSATNEALVVDTAAGRVTFMLDSMLDRSRYSDLRPGANVTVTHRVDTTGGQLYATQVTTTTMTDPSGRNLTTDTRTTDATYNSQTSADDRYAQGTLPSTAGPLVTVALIGLAALAGGYAIKKKRKHDIRPEMPQPRRTPTT